MSYPAFPQYSSVDYSKKKKNRRDTGVSIREDTELTEVSSQDDSGSADAVLVSSNLDKSESEQVSAGEVKGCLEHSIKNIDSSNGFLASMEGLTNNQASSTEKGGDDRAMSESKGSDSSGYVISEKEAIHDVEAGAEANKLSILVEPKNTTSHVSSYTPITAATLDSTTLVSDAPQRYERANPRPLAKERSKKSRQDNFKRVIVVTLLINVVLSLITCAVVAYTLYAFHHLNIQGSLSDTRSCRLLNSSSSSDMSSSVEDDGEMVCVDSQCEESLEELNKTIFSYFHSTHKNQDLLIRILEDPNLLFSESCATIHTARPTALSGYYWFRVPNGSFVSLYCDMDRTCGSITGGWTRLVRWDAVVCNVRQCPATFENTTYGGMANCGVKLSGHGPVCSTMNFSLPDSITFSKICGRVSAHIYGDPDAFNHMLQNTPTINDPYFDGVSLTHGSSDNRSHIWSFAAAGTFSKCPCHNNSYVPPFVGTDYFCDAPSPTSSALWQNCSAESCCNNEGFPWFYKELSAPVSDSVELRACADENRANKDVGINSVEIYVQ